MKFKDLENLGKDEAWCEWYRCEKCDDNNITIGSNFCPNCGEKIEK